MSLSHRRPSRSRFLPTRRSATCCPASSARFPAPANKYCVGDVLFHVENHLHNLNAEQRTALRDLLYIVYDRLESEIEQTAFDYTTLWRVLNELDHSP